MQPSYFYHLAFELYAPEARAYVPPPGTDIFEADLPVHDTIPWKASPPKRPSHKRSNTETFDSECGFPSIAFHHLVSSGLRSVLECPTAIDLLTNRLISSASRANLLRNSCGRLSPAFIRLAVRCRKHREHKHGSSNGSRLE